MLFTDLFTGSARLRFEHVIPAKIASFALPLPLPLPLALALSLTVTLSLSVPIPYKQTSYLLVVKLFIRILCILKACAQRFRYALFAFIHTQTYFEYYTLTLRLASLVKKAVIYAYWTKELFDICRENVSYMATLPSVARHVIHANNLRPRH